MPVSKRYPVSVNLRLTQDTYDAYKTAADIMGTDTTGLIRQMVDGGADTMGTIAQAFESMKAGNVLTGVNLMTAMMQSVLAQGGVATQEMQAIREQVQQQVAAGHRQAKSA